jgi:hypothetical protein
MIMMLLQKKSGGLLSRPMVAETRVAWLSVSAALGSEAVIKGTAAKAERGTGRQREC